MIAVAVVTSARGDDAHPWTAALAVAELTVEDVRLDPARWRGGGTLSLPAFDRLWDDPSAVSPTALALGRALVAEPTLEAACLRLPLPGADVPGHFSDAGTDLAVAVMHLHESQGLALDEAQVRRLRDGIAPLPTAVRAAAAEALRFAPLIVDEARAALAPFGDHPPSRAAEALALARYDVSADGAERLARIDVGRLLRAATLLARALDRASALLREAPPSPTSWSWDTPLGRIVIAGAGNDAHDGARTLLLLDQGGDDRYTGGGASAARGRLPLSMLIDAAGDDRYDARGEEAAFGAGILGLGALVDLRGDDVYRVASSGLGYGACGVGMLLDVEGRDRYEVLQLGQGAATAGAGLLLDLAGDDVYLCTQRAQGFAQTRGAGLLLDVAGDDLYVAQDELITRPSAQTAEHNTSLAQGCGFGRRAHPGDERSLGGGVGLLVDGAGNDRYRCGVFGQGTGYWYAAGLLVDLAGDDDYEGVYYAQAASAHYAVAGLVDAAGDDVYDVSMAQALGHANDLSVSVLHDLAGDDRYAAPGFSIGAALWNGVGVLQDDGGRDVYRCGASSLGDPGQGQCREGTPAFALFLDRGGGADLPPDHPRARASATWLVPGDAQHPRAIGVGRAAD
jgi:hypothetical protein